VKFFKLSRVCVFLVLSIIFFSESTLSEAQTYPNKPIRIIVGPGPDILARIVAEKLSESLAVSVIVEQKPAAGGLVAGDAVAKSQADGYTLLLSTGSFTINSVLQPNPPYSFKRDLLPISMLATLPFVLVVNSTSTYQSLKDVINYAKNNPGKVNFGSSGNGTPPHLAGEMLKQMAQIEMVHIPYKTAMAGMTDVLAGQVDLMFLPAPIALPMIRSEKLRPLVVTGNKRYMNLPSVPTAAETGFTQFSIVGWNGLHITAKTSPKITQLLSLQLEQILKGSDFQKKAIAAGFEPYWLSSDDFEKFVNQDLEKVMQVIKASNIQLD
jgi:tripartite-type tricarboxylate transporter receptor subunit TctC